MRPRLLLLAAFLASACAGQPGPAGPSGSATASRQPTAPPSTAPSPTLPGSTGSMLLVGRIVTMADPPEVESLLIVDGRVAAMGARRDVAAQAPPGTRTLELGSSVAYPGFIDAHSHWIGDREFDYGVAGASEAMQAAVSRGWTTIAELWVHDERLRELEQLDAAGELVPRVDAYLALSDPAGRKLGDWYTDLVPGRRSDRLRVAGLKIHLDTQWGSSISWKRDELSNAVERATERGWQVAVHTVGTQAHDMVLDAFEGALDGGPNALHHRIEHAIQVRDADLARMVDLGIVVVIHTDGAASDWATDPLFIKNLSADTALLARWRDFVDAGLRVASAVDTPWMFPELQLSDDIGRPMDQVAGGMDGRGRMNPDTPAWVLDQLLTPDQGLRAITTDAAYAINDEANRGRLAPGTYGDVTILSGDITAGAPDDIRSLSVIATIVGGVAQYCSDPAFCP